MTATLAPAESCDWHALALRRQQAIDWLYGRINYEYTPPARRGSGALKLARMEEMAERLGRPGLDIPTVHIAGTKGKGSTAAMLAAVLHAAGYRTGLFTSPHLEQIEERFCIDGVPMDQREFVELLQVVRPIVEDMDAAAAHRGAFGPTFFEICTALALVHFERARAEAIVLEVGLGGRLDATNICRPCVSVITSISYDHTRQLGNTLAEIAREKAGIIKCGVPVVSGVTTPEPQRVIEKIAIQRGAPLIELGRQFLCRYRPAPCGDEAAEMVDAFDYLPSVATRTSALPEHTSCERMGTGSRCNPIDTGESAGVSVPVPILSQPLGGLPLRLLGEHQAANAAVALAATAELVKQGWQITETAIRKGLDAVRLAARAEVIRRRPTVLLDTAHNVASVQALVDLLQSHFVARRRHLVFAATQDKDVPGMLALLLPLFDTVRLTRYTTNPRGLPLDELAELTRQCLHAQDVDRSCVVACFADPQEAWRSAVSAAAPDDLLCVTGSFFLAAELRL